MVKFNETLIVGISLLAALVLSKGSSILPRTNGISFIDPYTSQLSEAQAAAIQKGESNIEILQNIQQDILDYERNIANTKIDYLQTELSKTQSFISQQQRFTPANPNRNVPVRQAEYRDYFGTGMWQKFIQDRGVNQIDRDLILQQANFEAAQERISQANQLIFRQQAEIDRLEEEYQTRFGGLSRYG